MTISTIDESQRKAARVAGLSCLVTMAAVVFANLGIHDRLVVRGNAAETARNIMAHERLFRINIACDLIYCAGVVVLLTALYVILKPVSRSLAFPGRHVSQRLMWPLFVALPEPLFRLFSYFVQSLKHVHVQDPFTVAAIDSFDKAILHWFGVGLIHGKQNVWPERIVL